MAVVFAIVAVVFATPSQSNADPMGGGWWTTSVATGCTQLLRWCFASMPAVCLSLSPKTQRVLSCHGVRPFQMKQKDYRCRALGCDIDRRHRRE